MGNTHDTDQSQVLTTAIPNVMDLFHESWTCGKCSREFSDCTSCVAHEEQCGELTRW